MNFNIQEDKYIVANIKEKMQIYSKPQINTKYYNAYTTYNESKKIKGDGVYETSTNSYSTSWHQDYSDFVDSSKMK